jgi:hypothetical protein
MVLLTMDVTSPLKFGVRYTQPPSLSISRVMDETISYLEGFVVLQVAKVYMVVDK